MVLETPAPPARRTGLRARAVPSAKELPLRWPEPPPAEESPVRWERIDIDRYRVLVRGTVVGYIDAVGPVFVVLAGSRYDRAVEVLQALDFTRAVDAICPPETSPA